MGAPPVGDGAPRRVDRLRLSVTDRCDLRCSYCMPREGVSKLPRRSVLTIEEMVHVASLLVEEFSVRAVRLTGGEPLIRSGIERLVGLLGRLALDDLAMTTNGQRLARMAADLKRRGLVRVNVSLDTLEPDVFADLTGGGVLARTLEGIDAALAEDLSPVKLNAVVLRGINEGEVARIARYGLERGCEVRFLELMPIGVAGEPHGELFVPAPEILESLSGAFDLEPLPFQEGSTSRIHLADDSRGTRGRIGIISPQTEPFCETCGRLRLTTEGRLLGCLHEEGGVDLRDALRVPAGPDRAALAGAIERAIAAKPACRAGVRASPMHVVGG